jgi:hypothetical protein
MQQDDIRRKTQREQELVSATEKEAEDVTAETTQVENKKGINRDHYINESMAILSDYINLKLQAE